MKKESHKLITRKAIDIYCGAKHNQLTSTLNDSRLRSAVVKGSVDEDGMTFTRLLNWHFYPSNSVLKQQDKIECYKLEDIVTPTSERILTKRQNKFIDALDDGVSYKLFKTFGRILHHIQDMSTPSHVLPIYHAGGKSSDTYEIFLVKQSNKILTSALNGNTSLPVNSSIGLSNDYLQLYHSSAERLFEYLSSATSSFNYKFNGQPKEGDTNLFWKSFDSSRGNIDSPCNIEGFGVFGELGTCYGATEYTDGEGNQYEVSEDVYVKFAAEMTHMAIKDTIIALEIFETMINERYGYGEFVQDDPDSYDE